MKNEYTKTVVLEDPSIQTADKADAPIDPNAAASASESPSQPTTDTDFVRTYSYLT